VTAQGPANAGGKDEVMSGKEQHGGCVVAEVRLVQRMTTGGVPVWVLPGTLPDGACQVQLRPVTAEAEPTAPVRQIEAATALVRWLDSIRPHAPHLPPLSLPAAKTKISRAVEKGLLPAVGTGDECRIGRADLNAWLLKYMSGHVFNADAADAAEAVEKPDADEPDEDERDEIAQRLAQARARKEAIVRRNGDH